MSVCEPQLLSAYLDDELSSQDRDRIEQHLAVCEACSAELASLRASAALVRRHSFDDLKPLELERLHQAIRRESSEQSVFRLGMVLSAMAASVLIICSAWLMDAPGSTAGPGPTYVRIESPQWERVATTLRLDPLPMEWERDHSIQVADAQFAQWMLDGLKN